MMYKVLADFVLGGALISFALLIADVLGPLIGGGFAALPIRVGATIFIEGMASGEVVAYEMVAGALAGLFGAFFFAFMLSFLPRKIGVFRSFAVAIVVCAMVIYLSSPVVSRLLL